MAANFENQSSDRENSKPAATASKPDEHGLKQISSRSAQEIARDRSNQNTVAGSGGQAVTSVRK